MRHGYELTLAMRALGPITHGAGSEGNQQVVRTTRRNLLVEVDGQRRWLSLDVPAVSGASVKAALREYAVERYLRLLGVEEGTLSRDVVRLLVKGGKIATGGQAISHDETRRLRRICPPLAVFGFLDGNLTSPGQVQVSEVVPFVRELVDGGLFQSEQEVVPFIPIPLHQVFGEVQYFRHDQRTSRAALFEAEDGTTPKGSGRTRSKEERRELNESMPHSYQTIAAGTPLVGTIRLNGSSEVEAVCLLAALGDWSAAGAPMGGAQAKGHGFCELRVVRAVRRELNFGPVPVTGFGAEPEQAYPESGRVYHDYLGSIREEALSWLSGC